MSAFLYYLPIPDGKVREFAETWPSLRCHVETRGTDRGPDEAQGTCFCVPGRKTRLGYYPDKQRWRKFKVSDRSEPSDLWLGVETAAPPSPEDLLRERPYQGTPVKLKDGREWIVPLARALPQSLGLDEDGELKLTPEPRFLWVDELVEQIWKAIAQRDEDGTVSLTIADEWKQANDVLALNYHVGPEEASVLGLLDTQNVSDVRPAWIDWENVRKTLRDAVEADQKKSRSETPDSSSTASGETAAPPATSPPSPTSNSTQEASE